MAMRSMLSRAASRPAAARLAARGSRLLHTTPRALMAAEEAIELPDYKGWDAEMEESFQAMRQEVGTKSTLGPRPKIADSVLDLIGNTPMIRASRFAEKHGVKCELLMKCEYFNAGGSVKDRIGKRMVLDAEATGRIKPGDTLVEPTSGNTGIGLCVAGAVRGYKMIIALPQKMSGEKVNTMKALGATILRTPTEAAWDAPESHLTLSAKLTKDDPNAHVLDQYLNPSNPLAHYDGTAEEILHQTDEDVDVVVMTAGTGGTVSGTARKIKERLPNCQVVAVDPKGSILAVPDTLNDPADNKPYAVEGIGYDFVPSVCNQSVDPKTGTLLIDTWVKTEDQESFDMARSMIRTEGIMCGGSSGSALAGALKYIENQGGLEGKRVVVLLPDSIRNYMSKFLDDGWMDENGFTYEKEE